MLGSNNFYASGAHTRTLSYTHLCRVYTKIKCHSKFSGSYYATPEDEAEAEAEEVEADSEVYLADAAASIACDFCALPVCMCVCVSVCSYVVQSLNICSTNEIFRAQGTVLVLPATLL